jgi:arginase family enzyme
MSMRLIETPYTIGDESWDAGKGPGRLIALGAAAHAGNATVETVERGTPLSDDPAALMEVSRQLEPKVGQALAVGDFPLVLAGSCDARMGILSAFDHSHCGIFWIDAHGGYNTPESSISGFFGGVPLAQLEDLVTAIAARFTIRAAAITAINPDLDMDDTTAQTGLRIIDLLTKANS